MANRASIELLGDKHLQGVLKDLNRSAQKQIMKPSLRAAVVPIRKDAKRRATRVTGGLRKAIKSGVNKAGTQAAVFVSRKIELERKGRRYIPGNIAHIVEYGSKRSKASPFMLPALASKRQESLNLLGKRVALEIDKRIGKLSKKLI